MSTGAGGKLVGTGIGVVGLAEALPEKVRRNDWWTDEMLAEHLRRARRSLITRLEFRTGDVDAEVVRRMEARRADPFRGVRERRVVSEGERSSDFEVEAGHKALERAGLEAKDIDLLLVYSLVPDYMTPLNHCEVASRLGMRRDVVALGLFSGCGSFVSQLALASQLIKAGHYRNAMLIQSSLSTLFADQLDPLSVAHGDGTMAAVVGPVGADEGFVAYSQLSRGEMAGTVRLMPIDSKGEVIDEPWYRGDVHKRRLMLAVADSQSATTTGSRMATMCREACLPLLEEHGLEPKDVDFLIASQPTAWFSEMCCDALGIPTERSLTTYEKYAHLMAGSAPMNLLTAHREGRIKAGDVILVYSPGAGFLQATMLYRWHQAGPW